MTENASQNQQPPPSPYPYPYPYPPNPEEEDKVSLLDYWKLLVKWKYLIIAVTLSSVIGAVVGALKSTPIYRAHVLLAPIEEDSEGGLSALASRYSGLAAMAGINIPSRGGVKKSDESLAILRSRSFISKFIRDENLMPVLFEDAWNEEKSEWIAGIDKAPTIGYAFKVFSNIISVSTDRETGLVTLTVDWKDSSRVAEWANKLIKKLNLYVKERRVAEVNKNLAFLQQQLNSTNIAENRAILYDLIKSNTKTIMLANVTDEFAFKVLDPAFVPEMRIKPRRKRIVILGFIIGLGMGVGLAFLLNYVQDLKVSEKEKGRKIKDKR